jgi:hypothetical protein
LPGAAKGKTGPHPSLPVPEAGPVKHNPGRGAAAGIIFCPPVTWPLSGFPADACPHPPSEKKIWPGKNFAYRDFHLIQLIFQVNVLLNSFLNFTLLSPWPFFGGGVVSWSWP